MTCTKTFNKRPSWAFYAQPVKVTIYTVSRGNNKDKWKVEGHQMYQTETKYSKVSVKRNQIMNERSGPWTWQVSHIPERRLDGWFSRNFYALNAMRVCWTVSKLSLYSLVPRHFSYDRRKWMPWIVVNFIQIWFALRCCILHFVGRYQAHDDCDCKKVTRSLIVENTSLEFIQILTTEATVTKPSKTF